MGWKLLQLAVFTAVVGSNIHYEWTPNPLVSGAAAALAALAATVFLDLAASQCRRLSRHQRANQSHLTR